MREKPFLQIIIAITTALTYFLNEGLKKVVELTLITDSTRIVILVVVGILYLGASLLIKFDRSLSIHEANDREKIFAIFLEHLHAVYMEKWFLQNPIEIGPSVRINIMLATSCQSLHHAKREYLKMYYTFSIDDSYPDREQELAWYTKQGNCGRAWFEQQPKTWIKDDPEYNEATMLLTKEQEEITKRYTSVISIPLIKGRKVLGILNLDCNYKGDDPQFKDNGIKSLLCEEAHKLEKIIEGPIQGKSPARKKSNYGTPKAKNRPHQ